MPHDSDINSRFDILFFEEIEKCKKEISQVFRVEDKILYGEDRDEQYNCYQYDSGINSRFDILIFETAEEYLKRREIEKEKLRVEVEKEKKKVEEKGICQGCEIETENLRWVDNEEFYSCYQCFHEGLDQMGSVSVPMMNASQMRDYMEEYEWDEKCENNE